MKTPLSLLLIMVLFSCKEEAVPIVTTFDVTNITLSTAACGGTISDEGSGTVLSRGVCWGTGKTATAALNKTADGTGPGAFLSLMTGLTDGTPYYVRAYATNDAGTGYGRAVSFTTQNGIVIFNSDLTYGTVMDIDGNAYKTIQIGTQTWMAENLKTTKYANGDLIGTTTPDTLDILNESAPKYQWAYDGNESIVALYGRLYTWFAVTDSRNVCPTGWHVPSDEEWSTLGTNLGGYDAGKLRETGTFHWLSPNNGATNETGFTALPGGFRYYDGSYLFNRSAGYWFSSTEYSDYTMNHAYIMDIYYNNSSIYRDDFNKREGCSVRCIKDVK